MDSGSVCAKRSFGARSSLGLDCCAGTLVAIASFSDEAYSRLSSGQSFFDRTSAIQARTPSWAAWSNLLTGIWTWSEIIVILFNRKRRALHGFIAGTIVVVGPKPQIDRLADSGSPPP